MIFILTIGLETKRKHNRIHYLQNKYEKMQDMQGWRRNQYKRFVDVVSSNYMMTRGQRVRAKYIIDHKSLKSLCHPSQYYRFDWRAVVTAICFYVMKQDNPSRPLSYSRNFPRQLGLNKSVYDVIKRKLDEDPSLFPEVKLYYLVEQRGKATQ